MVLTPADLPPHIRNQLPGARESKRKASTQQTTGGKWACHQCGLDLLNQWLAQFAAHETTDLPPKVEPFTSWVAVERHQDANPTHRRYEAIVTSS